MSEHSEAPGNEGRLAKHCGPEQRFRWLLVSCIQLRQMDHDPLSEGQGKKEDPWVPAESPNHAPNPGPWTLNK